MLEARREEQWLASALHDSDLETGVSLGSAFGAFANMCLVAG